MPVTILPAAHTPKPHPTARPVESLEEFVHLSCPDSFVRGETSVIASSFAVPGKDGKEFYASSSSFVRCAIEAWGRHSHLVLRPEDMWFTILLQMNFHMEKHTESLRHLLVSHHGKKTLRFPGRDYHDMLDRIRDALQRNIKAPWMSDWISPGFSTSTIEDERTAIVLMMGMMQHFFIYSSDVICGIPSITLLGAKTDWQRLLDKIERLDDFGDEPKAYATRLRPILSRIVRTFDDPTAIEAREFWDQMVQAKVKHGSCGEPPIQYNVSGWILGLFYWNSTGSINERFSKGWGEYVNPGALQYDDVRYGEVPLETLPLGYAKVKFEIQNDDESIQGCILAGSIGKRIIDGVPDGYTAAVASQNSTELIKAADDGKERFVTVDERTDSLGCFAWLMRGLNCFCRKSYNKSTTTHNSEKRSAGKSESDASHSTIQPMSGWILFAPDKDVGPFFDDEEIEGPTVDAINSCKIFKQYT